jgi:formylglycine-generating enzyme required for sulfatase activity
MNMKRMLFFVTLLLICFSLHSFSQDVIEVNVQGISDGIRHSKQRDRDEAIMDAKLKAIERAGVSLKSVTEIEDFQLKKDWVESKAEATLLPGFNIIDIGYGEDGLYHIVLFGKVTTTSSESDENDIYEGMVFVKGGWFNMGSKDGSVRQQPVHQVLLNDFYIDKTEVTVTQYLEFCKAVGKMMPKQPPYSYGKHPVVNVTWHEANAYAEWIGKRLPTEAEWEYAARGGNRSKGYKYSGSNNHDEVAWYKDNSNGQTHSVGIKKTNELGLYDMSGNASEWCFDWYGSYKSDNQTNPRGPTSGSFRVKRGGNWDSNSYLLPVVKRNVSNPSFRSNNLGFRCSKAAR